MWCYQTEWSLLGGKRSAVHGIRDDYLGIKNSRIQFRQGEYDSIAVCRFGENVRGHRSSSQLFTLRDSGLSKEVFKKHSLVRFLLFVVRIQDGQRFPRHLLQVSHGQYKRGGDSTGDSQFRSRGRRLGKDRRWGGQDWRQQ